jgi:hypothetical protein
MQMNHEPDTPGRRLPGIAVWQSLLQACPILAAAAAILFVRAVLGFQFPVPWPDETGFVAPAFDFARHGTFFDPGLNPDRVVMWMPPGYMLLLAGVFRVFGYSFALARWVSALLCLTSLGLCAWLAWRLTAGWARVIAAWGLGLAFLSPYMLIDANLARMDMLAACIVLLALACAAAGRLLIAVSLVAAGMTVHFNVGYFAVPLALALADAAYHRRLNRPDGIDALAAAFACLALGLYAMHVLRNFPGFQADMAFQFKAKQFYGQNDPAHPLWPVLGGAALAALAFWRWRRFDGAAVCAAFGAAFIVMAHNGHEIWYDFGQPLGFALIALALLAEPAMPWRFVSAGAAIVFAAVMATRITPAMQPLLPTRAMIHRNIVAPAEIAKVRAFIATLKPGQTVAFGWTGMELFFLNDLDRVGARWTIIPHSVTQFFPVRTYDWRVVCDSSDWPAFLFPFDLNHQRQGRDTGCTVFPGDTMTRP